MALKKCKECGKKISNKAASCPNCGAPQKKQKQFGCLSSLLIVGGFTVALIVILSKHGTTTLDKQDNPVFTHRVLSVEDLPNYKLSMDIGLLPKNNVPPTQQQLTELAKYLYDKHGGKKYKRVFMCYYLPGMTVGSGAWATTHYNPNIDVRILGNIQQEIQPASIPAYKSLKAKCQYRFTGKFPLMPSHPDGLKGNTMNETMDELVKMKTVTTGPDGISVAILMVQPDTNTKTPWYFVKVDGVAGWINSIALRDVKIEKE